MITQPFRFEASLRERAAGFDLLPFINVAVLGLFFVLEASRFVFAPGIMVDLPVVTGASREVGSTTRVLTLSESQGAELLIFEGRMCTLESFEQLLDARHGDFNNEVMLVRADGDVSLQLIARVWELASGAGFKRILLAAETGTGARSSFP